MICAIYLIGQVKERLGAIMYPWAVKERPAAIKQS